MVGRRRGEPLIGALTRLSRVVPEPALAVGEVEPYAVVVPYWKYQLVVRPSGLTEPVSVTEVGPAPSADPVCDDRRRGASERLVAAVRRPGRVASRPGGSGRRSRARGR